jgi:hypothetical protein
MDEDDQRRPLNCRTLLSTFRHRCIVFRRRVDWCTLGGLVPGSDLNIAYIVLSRHSPLNTICCYSDIVMRRRPPRFTVRRFVLLEDNDSFTARLFGIQGRRLTDDLVSCVRPPASTSMQLEQPFRLAGLGI